MKQYLSLFLATCVASCSSVERPEASINLVNSKQVQESEYVSPELQSKLDSYSKNNENLSEMFFSAGDNTCRYITENKSKRLFCLDKNGRWFSVPQVMAISEEQLGGKAR